MHVPRHAPLSIALLMPAHTYARAHLRMHTPTHTPIYACRHERGHVRNHVEMHACAHAATIVRLRAHAQSHVRTSPPTRARAHTHTNMHTYTGMHAHCACACPACTHALTRTCLCARTGHVHKHVGMHTGTPHTRLCTPVLMPAPTYARAHLSMCTPTHSPIHVSAPYRGQVRTHLGIYPHTNAYAPTRSCRRPLIHALTYVCTHPRTHPYMISHPSVVSRAHT